MAVKVDQNIQRFIIFPINSQIFKNYIYWGIQIINIFLRHIETIAVRILGEFNAFVSTIFLHQDIALSKIHALLFIG